MYTVKYFQRTLSCVSESLSSTVRSISETISFLRSFLLPSLPFLSPIPFLAKVARDQHQKVCSGKKQKVGHAGISLSDFVPSSTNEKAPDDTSSSTYQRNSTDDRGSDSDGTRSSTGAFRGHLEAYFSKQTKNLDQKLMVLNFLKNQVMQERDDNVRQAQTIGTQLTTEETGCLGWEREKQALQSKLREMGEEKTQLAQNNISLQKQVTASCPSSSACPNALLKSPWS